MSHLFADALEKVRSKQDLTANEMQALVETMLQGAASDDQVGALLLALRDKGEALSEMVGAARGLRAYMTPIESPHEILLDTCGTGGDGSGTFNISTAAALVIAAAGVPVAKHGNRRVTSSTGSADVLRSLGVRVDAPREIVQQCLVELGICFCYAPSLHPAMKHVAQVRQKLGVRTLFNLIGPLCNPAGATHQVMGTGSHESQVRLAAALKELGIVRAAVLFGEDGMDEVTLSAKTQVIELAPNQQRSHQWSAEDFGLHSIDKNTLQASDPDASATILRDIFSGTHGPHRDIVVANAAAGLWLAGRHPTVYDAARAAEAAIDAGTVQRLLGRLAELTQQTSPKQST